MVEESVNSRKLNIFNRFDADITDLLRVDPDNDLGRKYWNEMNHEQTQPPFTLPPGSAGVPAVGLPAGRRISATSSSLINWYIDNRQISNGEFGGGLSDDSDFLNWWPGLALMGVDPDKLKSLAPARPWTRCTPRTCSPMASPPAQYDELHSYEDGINVLGQSMMIDFGSPKQIERAMVHREAARVADRHQRRRPSADPLVLLQRRRRWPKAASGDGRSPVPTSSFIPRSRSCSSTACPGLARW